MLLVQARHDTRDWVVKRRERTRQLIELGGLIVKASLVDLANDDRVAIYGALVELTARARGEQRDQILALWKRRGKRAFETETQLANSSPSPPPPPTRA